MMNWDKEELMINWLGKTWIKWDSERRNLSTSIFFGLSHKILYYQVYFLQIMFQIDFLFLQFGLFPEDEFFVLR
jgi:hypothetical protein